ncbi:MAG: hypothetical protein AAB968_00775 [Patescibacteria group bacterium]
MQKNEEDIKEGFMMNTFLRRGFGHTSSSTDMHQPLTDIPIAQYSFGEVLIQIYRVKNLHSSEWNSPQLKQYLMHARQSYLRYGHVPLIDKFDTKSEVYITRVLYSIKTDRLSYPVEEWLSMRFVPSDGYPGYTEDLLYSLCEDKPLIQWLSESNFGRTRDSAQHMIAISRICSISPRKIPEYKYEKDVLFPKKLGYTAISFALMNKIFLDNLNPSLKHYKHMTGIFRDEFIDRVLTVRTPEKEIVPDFTFGYKLLELNHVHMIRLDRSAPLLYPYHFPNYFFHIDQLHGALNNLYSKGFITQKTFIYYMGTEAHPDKWTHNLDHFKKISPKLKNILTVIGPLYGTSITGEEMRTIFDQEVDDGPKLRIMNMDAWHNSIEKYLRLNPLISP